METRQDRRAGNGAATAGSGSRLRWEGEAEDARAARRAAERRAELAAHTTGEPLTLGNEFAEIRVSRVETRNGSRLLVESTRSGQWVALCPLELEALTWQNTATFAEMIGRSDGPLFPEEPEADGDTGAGSGAAR